MFKELCVYGPDEGGQKCKYCVKEASQRDEGRRRNDQSSNTRILKNNVTDFRQTFRRSSGTSSVRGFSDQDYGI